MTIDLRGSAVTGFSYRTGNAFDVGRRSDYDIASRDGHLTDEQFGRLKAELEAGFQGARNAGRPMLLEGGLDWKPLSMSPKDMDFVEAKNAAAREIALALGVPASMRSIAPR